MENVVMTAEERQEFETFKAQKAEKERLEKQTADRETYKKLVDEAIESVFPNGRILAMLFCASKKRIYDAFKDILALKADTYRTKEGQQSHTWTHSNGKLRVILGYNVTDNYDDTVTAGIEKVTSYISSLADSEKTQALVNAIFRLLAKDEKTGALKASKVVQLKKMAKESGDAQFIDGVQIIEDAYRPVLSKQYVKMHYKGEFNEWVSVPLSMTEAKNSDLTLSEYNKLMETVNNELAAFITPV